jgi:hypothetical protein
LLGPRKIDSLTIAFARAYGLTRSGAMRSLAAFVADRTPDVLAISEIDDGDALALATRFDYRWAYRGGQSLLWNRRFAAERLRDAYLPISPARAFGRRGLLRIDGACDGLALTLFATQFEATRWCVRELRFTRAAMRGVANAAIAFVAQPAPGRIGFDDLGFRAVAAQSAPGVTVAIRGFACAGAEGIAPRGGLGSALIARLVEDALSSHLPQA